MSNKLPLLILVILTVQSYCFGQDNTKAEEVETGYSLFNIKTNLLYDATATINVGVEYRLSDRTSFDLSGNWNPWTFGNNRKWKHLLVQPEFRLWTKETFGGHFFGLHGHYSYYNVGNLPKPPFSQNMKDSRYEGWLAGAGVGYGYRWNFNHWLGLEAEIGVGYAYLDYDKYTCGTCGELLGSAKKHYFGPTKAAVSLIYSFGGKKKSTPPTVVYAPPAIATQPEPKEPVAPQYTVTYSTPETETVKARTEVGRAYLDFELGKADIISSFKNNATELQKMHTLITQLKNDPDVTITRIAITGFASPEGTWATNLNLSEKRARALKGHIQSVYDFSGSFFIIEGRGEDWDTLDSIVSDSFMADKYQILEIIRGIDNFDEREQKLKGLSEGKPYRELLTTIFPQLRRSDYQLHYTVVPFTVEKGKEVFKENPARLSLNELFLIANTYAPGSSAFNEVFETAARIYPDNDNALVNSAACALERGDHESASRYLERVKTPSSEYHNNTGILYTLRGEYELAAIEFEKALNLGNELVVRNLTLLNKYRKEAERYEQKKRETNNIK